MHHAPQLEEGPYSDEDPAWPKVNKFKKEKFFWKLPCIIYAEISLARA